MTASAAENLEACWNAGAWEAVVAIVTPRFLETAFGVEAADAEERAQALAALDLGPLRIASISPAGIWSDGRGVVDVFYLRGGGSPDQAVAARWFFIAEGGRVRFNEEALQPPPPLGDRITIGFAIAGDDQAPQWASAESSEIPASPVIALHGANRGRTAHTVILEATDGHPLGLLTLPPGGQGDLVLLHLPPGRYRLSAPTLPGPALELMVGDG
jgi:hypothetical protein